MINELKNAEFIVARSLFSGLEEYNLSILSVFEGNYPGRIFVNDKRNPNSGFIYLGRRTFNFVGSPKDASFNKEVIKVLEEDIFPNNREKGSKNFMIFYDPGWDKEIKRSFKDLLIEDRRFYAINRKERRDWKPTLSPDFTIEKIEREFVERKAYTYPDEIPVERWITILWGSHEEFYRRGFAFAVVYKKSVVSSSFCNYLSNDKRRCDIGIITATDFHRRGLGKNLVSHVLEHCWQLGIERVEWHTSKENIASRKLAESVGFKFNKKYQIYHGKWQ
ncbi:MAG: GNAT family N-acetyltransferase [Candidatus Heimdallarchaeota archaeon]|nr:GNAT family N-acetyltransferase [Candidatus Heimdallarchaeota archaeon]MCK4955048.1 GNAT family N-acetyltransferase [Candidatus Heimdallarchaeota archaeon]